MSKATLSHDSHGTQAEVALAAEQAFVESALNALTDIFFVFDEEGRFLRWNDRLTQVTGYSDEEMAQAHPFDFFHEGDVPIIAEAIRATLRVGENEVEAQLVTKDGRSIPYEFRAALLRDREGQPLGLCGIGRDISERQSAEEALRQSEQHKSALLDAIPDAIVRITRDGTYLDVELSREYEAFLDADALVGRTAYEVLPSDVARRAMQSVHAALETGRTQQFEYEIDVEGERHVREARVVACGPDEVVSIQRDITERKRAEEALRQSREQLRELAVHLQSVREEERTRMAREVHDVLGQQLTALRMDTSWLRRELPVEAGVMRERLERMQQQVDETIRTVRRIAAELRPGVLDDLGLAAAIEWQAGRFQERTDITCRFSSGATELKLDRQLATAFFRIFQETLTNVVRHAEASCVEVRLATEEGALVLEVRDDGCGIRPEHTRDSRSLGLLGMRERVQPWGGRVTFDGAPQQGTTVTVRVPLGGGETVRR